MKMKLEWGLKFLIPTEVLVVEVVTGKVPCAVLQR